MMLPAQYDRFPFSGLESGVHPIGFRGHFIQELLISRYVCSARRPDLHERKAPLIRGIHLDETFNTAEPLDNPLGVIDAVYTHAQQRPFYPQLIAEFGSFLTCRAPFFLGLAIWKGDADRVRPNPCHMSLPVDREAIPFG